MVFGGEGMELRSVEIALPFGGMPKKGQTINPLDVRPTPERGSEGESKMEEYNFNYLRLYCYGGQ